MKKIFFMAVSAVLLAAGCQKTEIQNEVLPKIGFDTHMGKLTKADAPDAGHSNRYANLNAQGFMVWGYFATEGDLNYKVGDLYLGNPDGSGIKVTATNHDDLKGETTTWTTNGGTYYWPGKNKELNIYAVSLNEDTENNYGDVSIENSKSELTINFEVNGSADNDLMVAPMITQDQDDDEYVRPEFTHALAKVLVNFKKSPLAGDSRIYIISAKTSPIANAGTLTVSNKPLGENETFLSKNVTWSSHGGNMVFTDEYKDKTLYPKEIIDLPVDYGNPHAVELVYDIKENESDDNVPVPVDFASWLLIPQDINNTTLEVEYIVDDMYINQSFELCTDAVPTWGKNTQTTYNVTIAPDYITFTPVVEDWIDGGDHDRGEFPEYSVSAKAADESEVTLYYNGDLKENTAVYVKDEINYVKATDGVYTIEREGEHTIVITVVNGKINDLKFSVNATCDDNVITLYYEGDLQAAGTVIYEYKEGQYVPVASGTYTIGDGENAIVLIVGADGKVEEQNA